MNPENTDKYQTAENPGFTGIFKWKLWHCSELTINRNNSIICKTDLLSSYGGIK